MTVRSLGGVILCAALCLAGPAAALDPARPISEYGFQSWGSREGLPQNTINGIGQTADGYLWIATRSGLVRFDGVRFILVDASEIVEELASGPAGRLRVGFTRGRLIELGAGGETREIAWARRAGDRVHSLFTDPAGTVWAGTSRGLARQRGNALDRVSLP